MIPASRIKARSVPLANLFVIGNRKPTHVGMTENNVAACLMIYLVSQFFESADSLLAGANRQPAHAGISTISSLIGGGTGSPCFLRLATYPVMASFTLRRASARVLPWEMHPGSAGHSATKTPSSSTSIITRYFIACILALRVKKSIVAATGNVPFICLKKYREREKLFE